ncbi:MAG TPA: winged helix-turn-helix transcriptional regulator [Syntrophomonadaceae bacterium]|nr:winged helix-turn-helix transcriptional regulator [Syntrophomonadaceae bacterium]
MRLTAREKEILEFIKKHPMISQDDLGAHFGITRSSAAVHISNLMKKGAIMGKGYVVNEQVSIVVIGRAYLQIDIRGGPEGVKIDLNFQGFALNSCRSLRGLGLDVKVITVVGNDALASELVEELQQGEADIASLFRHPEKRSTRRVFINDVLAHEEGFSMEDYSQAFTQKEWVAVNCQWLILEPIFKDFVYRKWMEKDVDRLPSICTCLTVGSAAQMPEYLSRFSVLVVGVEEGSQIETCAERLAELMHEGYALVCDGDNQLLYVQDGSLVEFPLLPNQKFNLDTALPYLLGGLVYGLSCGYNMRQAVRMAVGAACSSS